MTGERVMVYMDGSNLFHSLRAIAGRVDLDFGKFVTELVGDRRLVRAYYYSAQLDQSKEPENYRGQQRLFAALRATEYLELRVGRLVYRNWPQAPAYEKGVDIKIATDMLVHACRRLYDVAILVSADTDFAEALQAIKEFGLHTEVALFDQRGSQQLRHVSDRVIEIDDSFLQDCWSK